MSSRTLSAAELQSMTATEAAAYWFVREDVDCLPRDERRAFEAWLAADADHRGAYERTTAMWRNFERDSDQSELRVLRTAALASSPAPVIWKRLAFAAAALVAIVVASVMGLQFWPALQQGLLERATGDFLADEAVAYYQTANTERSTVTLSDGTMVSMNLDTRLAVTFTAERRRVEVVRGQAFFQVAQDVSRPFVVAAADRQIVALGTQFDVRLDSGRVQVVLLEGRVAVEPVALVPQVARSESDVPVELEPGERLVAVGGAVSVTRTNAEHATSWRQGWIVFEDESLEAAVAELNRYSQRPLVVPDRNVSQLRLSGVFRIGQPDRFGAIIQELLPVRTVPGDGGALAIVQLDVSSN